MSNHRKNMTAAARRDDILSAAVRLSATKGYLHVTRDDIALAAGCSPALVSNCLGTMVQLRRAIMGAAIANEVLPVIAQGLAAKDKRAQKVSVELQKHALATLVRPV